MQSILMYLSLLSILATLFSCNKGSDDKYSISKSDPHHVQTSQNILWLGLPQHLDITLREGDTVMVDRGKTNTVLEQDSAGQYIISAGCEGQISLLIIAPNEQIKHEAIFEVHRLPDNELKLCGNYLRTIPRAALQSCSGLQIRSIDESLPYEIIISSFSLTTWSKGKTATLISESDHGQFSSDQRKMLAQLDSGDYIFIEEIYVQNSFNQRVMYPGTSFQVSK